MAITYIAGVNTAGNASTLTSSSIDTTGADLLVAFGAWYDPGYSANGLSDSKSNTWNFVSRVAGMSGIGGGWFWCVPSSVGSGHTFTFNNSYPCLSVMAFSGVKATSPLDQQSSATKEYTTGSTTLQPGSVTPAENNEVLVCGCAMGNNGTMSIDGGFTEPNAEVINSHTDNSVSVAYLIQTTSTAANPTWTLAGAFYGASAVILTFKAAAAGGGVIPVFVHHYRMQGIS